MIAPPAPSEAIAGFCGSVVPPSTSPPTSEIGTPFAGQPTAGAPLVVIRFALTVCQFLQALSIHASRAPPLPSGIIASALRLHGSWVSESPFGAHPGAREPSARKCWPNTLIVFPERLSSHAAITPPAPSEARTSVFWALGARVIGLPFQDQPAAQGRAGAKSSRRLERRNTPTREARTTTPMISTTAGHHNGRAQATHNLLYTGILVESNPEGNGLEFSVSVGPPCRPAAANGF